MASMTNKVFSNQRNIAFVQKGFILGFLLILLSLVFGYLLGSGGLFPRLIVFVLFFCFFLVFFVIKINWVNILTFILVMVPLYLHEMGSESAFLQEVKNYLIPLIFFVLVIKNIDQRNLQAVW